MVSSCEHIKVLLLLGLPHQLPLSVNLLLNLCKLDVALDNVDVGGSHQTAHLSNIVELDLSVAMSASHGLAKTDERLKLSDSDLVGRTSLGILFILPHALELLLEHLSRFFSELRLDRSAKLDVGLQLLSCEVRL